MNTKKTISLTYARTWWIDMIIVMLATLAVISMPKAGHAEEIPTGAVDTFDAATGYVAGWAADADTPEDSIFIQVYIGKPMDAKHFVMNFRANERNRQDVNKFQKKLKGNHGFEFFVPTKYHDGNQYEMVIMAVDDKGKYHNPLEDHRHKTIHTFQIMGNKTPETHAMVIDPVSKKETTQVTVRKNTDPLAINIKGSAPSSPVFLYLLQHPQGAQFDMTDAVGKTDNQGNFTMDFAQGVDWPEGKYQYIYFTRTEDDLTSVSNHKNSVHSNVLTIEIAAADAPAPAMVAPVAQVEPMRTETAPAMEMAKPAAPVVTKTNVDTNMAPTVTIAGLPESITINEPLTPEAQIVDDGASSISQEKFYMEWIVYEGAEPVGKDIVTINNKNNKFPVLTFLKSGNYELYVIVDDGEKIGIDTTPIIVKDEDGASFVQGDGTAKSTEQDSLLLSNS